MSPRRVRTLYVGGGTPSALGAAPARRLLAGLAALLDAPPDEFTVEANPDSADERFLRACAAAGVTRLSVGVQSFSETCRRAVRRGGAAAGLGAALGRISAFFPGAFSIDLMTGLPFQTLDTLRKDIDRALSFEPGHLSLYALSLEEGTPLAERALHAPEAAGLPSRDEADALWIAGRDALEAAGFAQYEVSNFCRSGKESLHNIRYWRMQSWIGLGPSASGTLIPEGRGKGALRATVEPCLERWLARRGEAPVIREELDAVTLMKETFLMGFRYLGGPDPALFEERFGISVDEAAPRTLAAWRARGLARSNKPALNRDGLLFLDRFLAGAFLEIEQGRGKNVPRHSAV